MEKKATNIYPIFDRMMSRDDKEQLLRQRGMMLWFTGLSGSGKSTVAIALERELHSRGLLCRILDGDNITLDTSKLPVEESVKILLDYVLPKAVLKK